MDKQKGQEKKSKDRSTQQRDKRSGHQPGSGYRPPERERDEQERDDH
jgi:hypothetical protein